MRDRRVKSHPRSRAGLSIRHRPLGNQQCVSGRRKLRLEISSSNFPRFDRNLNLGEPSGSAWNHVAAKNSILHNAAYPSRRDSSCFVNDVSPEFGDSLK
jgi:predicted acyl esterase